MRRNRKKKRSFFLKCLRACKVLIQVKRFQKISCLCIFNFKKIALLSVSRRRPRLRKIQNNNNILIWACWGFCQQYLLFYFFNSSQAERKQHGQQDQKISRENSRDNKTRRYRPTFVERGSPCYRPEEGRLSWNNILKTSHHSTFLYIW